jgi:hypothetical protein
MADEITTTNDSENSTTENPSTSAAENNSSTTTPNEGDDNEAIDLGKGGEEAGDADADTTGDASKDGDKEDTRTDEEKAADEARAALFGAPEGDAGYAIEGLPEGVTVDQAALDAATPIFKELGLSNAGASKVAGVYAEKVLPIVAEQFQENLKTQIADQRTEWQGETLKAVKGEIELKTATGEKIDFAGSGVKQVQQAAARAIDRVAPAGFREFLDETGLGMHPAMVAFAFKVGQLISEDTDSGGGGGSGGDHKPTRTEKYYGR